MKQAGERGGRQADCRCSRVCLHAGIAHAEHQAAPRRLQQRLRGRREQTAGAAKQHRRRRLPLLQPAARQQTQGAGAARHSPQHSGRSAQPASLPAACCCRQQLRRQVSARGQLLAMTAKLCVPQWGALPACHVTATAGRLAEAARKKLRARLLARSAAQHSMQGGAGRTAAPAAAGRGAGSRGSSRRSRGEAEAVLPPWCTDLKQLSRPQAGSLSGISRPARCLRKTAGHCAAERLAAPAAAPPAATQPQQSIRPAKATSWRARCRRHGSAGLQRLPHSCVTGPAAGSGRIGSLVLGSRSLVVQPLYTQRGAAAAVLADAQGLDAGAGLPSPAALPRSAPAAAEAAAPLLMLAGQEQAKPCGLATWRGSGSSQVLSLGQV